MNEISFFHRLVRSALKPQICCLPRPIAKRLERHGDFGGPAAFEPPGLDVPDRDSSRRYTAARWSPARRSGRRSH